MSIYQNNFLEIKQKTNHYILVFKETKHNIDNFIEKTCSMIDYSKKKGTKNVEITFHAKSVETLASLLKTKKINFRIDTLKIYFLIFQNKSVL